MSAVKRVIYAGNDALSSALYTLVHRADVKVVLCITGEFPETSRQVLELCRKHCIPFKTGPFNDDICSAVYDANAALLLSAAFPYKIPVARLNLPHALNIHPSLLPYGRGPNPFPYLVSGRQSKAGVTLHRMTDSFDAGPILFSIPLKLKAQDGFDTATMMAFAAAAQVTERLFDEFDQVLAGGVEQRSGAYWPMPADEFRTVDWSMSVDEVLELNRRFGMNGIIFKFGDGRSVIARSVAGTRCAHRFPVGEIVLDGGAYRFIALRDGLIRTWF